MQHLQPVVEAEWNKKLADLEEFIEEFADFLNGNTADLDQVPHCCAGRACRCGGDEGRARDIAIDLFDQLLFKVLPHPASPSKWWAQLQNLVTISAGVAVHGILGATFTKAFDGEGEVRPEGQAQKREH